MHGKALNNGLVDVLADKTVTKIPDRFMTI
jgi:hypothetical protein